MEELFEKLRIKFAEKENIIKGLKNELSELKHSESRLKADLRGSEAENAELTKKLNKFKEAIKGVD